VLRSEGWGFRRGNLECKKAAGIDGVGDWRTSIDDDAVALSSAAATPVQAMGVVSSSRLWEGTSEQVLVCFCRPPRLLLLDLERYLHASSVCLMGGDLGGEFLGCSRGIRAGIWHCCVCRICI
jgi:hypothetical protein